MLNEIEQGKLDRLRRLAVTAKENNFKPRIEAEDLHWLLDAIEQPTELKEKMQVVYSLLKDEAAANGKNTSDYFYPYTIDQVWIDQFDDQWKVTKVLSDNSDTCIAKNSKTGQIYPFDRLRCFWAEKDLIFLKSIVPLEIPSPNMVPIVPNHDPDFDEVDPPVSKFEPDVGDRYLDAVSCEWAVIKVLETGDFHAIQVNDGNGRNGPIIRFNKNGLAGLGSNVEIQLIEKLKN